MRYEQGRYWDKGITLVAGCTPCSPGCEHCWALAMDRRFKPELKNQITVHPDRLSRFNTRKPKVFSLWNDLFHDDVPDSFIERALSTAIGEHRHTFLVLTKRAERMASLMSRFYADAGEKELRRAINVWCGLTVCNQQEADEKIPIFLLVPGKKFLSIEPMLGPINLMDLPRPFEFHQSPYGWPQYLKRKIDAVILGGETGPGARPLHPDWVRSVRDQCATAGVDFFFKSWGEWIHYTQYSFGTGCPDLSSAKVENELYRVGRNAAARILDGRTHDALPWRQS